MNKSRAIFYILVVLLVACGSPSPTAVATDGETGAPGGKVVIYQLVVRLFGNKATTNKYYGSLAENGSGKFDDVTDTALDELKKLGISHVWYTGVLEHATMSDHTASGIPADDPDVIKGRAGSPYAVKDYYDVDPDLAKNTGSRMAEFEHLVARTHQHGMKVLIDFIPNHVSRVYHSDAKPAGVEDFGAADDKTKPFSPANNFYYLPGKALVLPAAVNAGGPAFKHALKDGRFPEDPAKATGNNVFNEHPSLDDWFETVKLNYGVDYTNNEKEHFAPVPSTWIKMRDILLFWASKNVDGFRCDVAEMVPVAFWEWVIPQVKKVSPGLIFIAEAYNADRYKTYITTGGFDYLYDKVGLYDQLKKLVKQEPGASVSQLRSVIQSQDSVAPHMLRFLENHDEERIASKGFAGDPRYAVPAMVATATLSGSPLMIYFGQEVGEPGAGKEGFGGDDSRTTIFDYWGVPAHQKWMNNGRFDGGKLTPQQKSLRTFYHDLLNLAGKNEAIVNGNYLEIKNFRNATEHTFAYVRYTKQHRVLVVLNFDRKKALKTELEIPATVGSAPQADVAADLLTAEKIPVTGNVIKLTVKPSGASIIAF